MACFPRGTAGPSTTLRSGRNDKFRVICNLLADDFYDDAVGEGFAAEQDDAAVS